MKLEIQGQPGIYCDMKVIDMRNDGYSRRAME